MSLQLLSLPYTPDAAHRFFAPIAHCPYAMLLDSAHANHVNSRFDILVADPLLVHQYQDGTNQLRFRDGRIETQTGCPFALLEQLQSQYLPPLDAPQWADLPFIGGALGFWSYDLGRAVETLPSLATNDSQLPQMVVGLYDWALLVDHQQQQVFLISPEPNARLTWLNTQQASKSANFALTSDWQAAITKTQYQQAFAKIQDWIQAGDCYEINFAQRFQATYQGDEWQAYQALVRENGAPFSAFLRFDDYAFLSVSPERFLWLDGDFIETKPIKGTRPRHADPTQDAAIAKALQQAPKDRAENVMIVDLLRNDMGRVATPGSVQVPSLFAIESFPAVHHLVSTVTATLAPQYSACDLLKACFPGGSITGAPKVRAMEIIETLESHRRQIYCGSIGYISRHGKMDTNIAIRTLSASHGQLHAWAGGAIVADSDVNEEYQETLDKLSRILPTLSAYQMQPQIQQPIQPQGQYKSEKSATIHPSTDSVQSPHHN
ncbi:Aminodeoxychorismate synthase component 1 [Vibrio stylophorae]|uniref:aminodeoxychorismate synthase n=1 Tax=Vibrio stylophorae TaxID=659351 RepID=A0ABN8DVC6_9VIBR|nr:aminodeoxychorismate synthase component I [Vibrio stylophorae]CAH0533803.1 Aminodeoxychorismate synthase component 1 [Vibrio stylophorae]